MFPTEPSVDSFNDEWVGDGCPRLQIYNDGTGLVIEYPFWQFSEAGSQNSGPESRCPSMLQMAARKVITVLRQCSTATRDGIDLIMFGGLFCGGATGLMFSLPGIGLSGLAGSAVKHAMWAGLL